MGQLPKYKMEEAKRAQKEAKLDKKRGIETKLPNFSILIVCEGERTEPNYFEAKIDQRYSKVIEVDVKGEGRGTVSLVKRTMKLRDENIKKYDRVWAVFDKDDFNDFNEAIKLAKTENIECAWSNESFELWYCLHFIYLDTGVLRSQYINILEEQIKNKTKNKKYKYKKNDFKTYSLLQENGNEEHAIRYAKKQEENHSNKNYKTQNPCTMVYKLVEELNNPEKLLYTED